MTNPYARPQHPLSRALQIVCLALFWGTMLAGFLVMIGVLHK